MTKILNLIGLVGFSALLSGVYIQYGLAKALMLGGVLLLIFALLALKKVGGRRAQSSV
ncbi:hypothetical protein [Vibrio fluvialis]|uniref:hypothetical protein n=1 Tax=Vibrio fluvialis TaxID=676 RepID=UPI00399BAA86